MHPRTQRQILVISGAFLLFAVLFFARTSPPPSDKAENTSSPGSSGLLTPLINAANSALNKEEAARVKVWQDDLSAGTAKDKKIQAADSLMSFWDDKRKLSVSAVYAEQKAEQTGSLAHWTEAGKRYHAAARFTEGENKAVLYEAAIRCFREVYSKDSLNLQLKTQLGVCLVEGSADPMKGISLLRDVLKADSANVEAQLNLGIFSVRSGQYEKAVERFNNVLRLDPGNLEVYLFLADAWERQGNKENAISALEKYKSLIADNTAKAEIQNYIDNLKNN